MFTNNFSLLFILFYILSNNLSFLTLKKFSCIFLSLSIAAKQYYHTCNGLEQHTFIVSPFPWVGNPSLAELGQSARTCGCSDVAGTGISSEKHPLPSSCDCWQD
ncbi:unnamed protein product [Rangifer tarandus platyrhynchus]|uniref:Secreted protein n=2 Tax=Rangifer tarandus platyrhynchus TaxID=3082113 RepID=A0ABN8YSJ1_RANTA|nr:unnamed protein product [Rangifer tarandus platyrhynchus]